MVPYGAVGVFMVPYGGLIVHYGDPVVSYGAVGLLMVPYGCLIVPYGGLVVPYGAVGVPIDLYRGLRCLLWGCGGLHGFL